MLKFTGLFLTLVSFFIMLSACQDVEEDKDLESIAITPKNQVCTHYDTSADNSSYTSGPQCDNSNRHYIQFRLTGTYSNNDTENLTQASYVTWVAEDEDGDSASILSSALDGLAYITTQGTFNIIATYEKKASSENEDDIYETSIVTLKVQ